jgi:hypothetical protein
MGQLKRVFNFFGQAGHYFIVFTKHLRAHTIGIYYDIFIGVQSLNKTLNGLQVFVVQGVVTQLYGNFHANVNLRISTFAAKITVPCEKTSLKVYFTKEILVNTQYKSGNVC